MICKSPETGAGQPDAAAGFLQLSPKYDPVFISVGNKENIFHYYSVGP